MGYVLTGALLGFVYWPLRGEFDLLIIFAFIVAGAIVGAICWAVVAVRQSIRGRAYKPPT